MLYDPSNPVVQLCVKGIETEYSGNLEKADALYREAWQLAKTNLEFATVAHYLARVQSDPGEALQWNLMTLEYARTTEDQDITSLYPSLYLNVAKSYEDLGKTQEAHAHYLLAQSSMADLPEDGYSNMIRKGIVAGLERVGFSRKRLPYCKYPGAADTEQHGLQPLPDVLATVNWDTARQYRSSKFEIIKADSLSIEKLFEMIRVIACSFAVNDPTLRHLNLPKEHPAELSAIKHKDPLGDDYFGDWTKENLIYWSIRLFYITDPFSPLDAIENNMDTIRQSLAVLNDAGEVIGGVLNIKIDISKTGRSLRDNDSFFKAVFTFFEPLSQLITAQLNLSINAICKKYPAFLKALKEGKVADLNMVARSALLPSEDTFEMVAASAEHLQQLGFQYLVVSAGNQWTGAAMEIMSGVKVHFVPFRDIKRIYESNGPLADKPSSKDGYISDKDSGSMLYVLRLM